MELPHKISTLLYAFTESDEIILIERTQEPNRGLWSPPGGKLKTWIGESPYRCACREAEEEMGLQILAGDLHLTGLISEAGYQGRTHWLMFLFEIKKRLQTIPHTHREGRFAAYKPWELAKIPIPDSDRDFLWPRFWEHRGGFFSAHAENLGDNRMTWTLEESLKFQV